MAIIMMMIMWQRIAKGQFQVCSTSLCSMMTKLPAMCRLHKDDGLIIYCRQPSKQFAKYYWWPQIHSLIRKNVNQTSLGNVLTLFCPMNEEFLSNQRQQFWLMTLKVLAINYKRQQQQIGFLYLTFLWPLWNYYSGTLN
jgi:hypothetical protein